MTIMIKKLDKKHRTSSTYKLHIQVAEVVMEIALERMDRLKISDGRTHPIGAICALARSTLDLKHTKQTKRV